MKKLSFVLTVALMAIATTASAQFANSGKNATKVSTNTENYNRFMAAYNSFTFSADGGSIDLTGLSVGWNKGIGIVETMPLYVETGLHVMYAFGSKYGSDQSYLGVNVPVLLTYKITPSETVAVSPYAGLNLRGNIVGNESDADYKYDYFDDFDAKRFGVGVSLGVNVDLNKVSLGVGYTTDFTEFMEEIKIDYFTVALGFKF